MPGSGKSYFAVYKLWSLFLYEPKKTFISKFIKPPAKPEYLYCYTNINEFKFELDDRFIKFDFDEFYSGLETLHALYINQATDKEINEKAKELKLYKVLIVLDEAHNFLKAKEDNLLVWWLTYHRHLHHDIYLITQDLSLISNEYKRIAEKFYRAIDSSKRLFSSKFKYAYYSSYKMNISDRVNSFNINIPFNPEVFNLYHSGANSKSRSIVLFYVVCAVALAILTCALFYNSFTSLFVQDTEQITKNQTVSESVSVSRSSPHQTQPKSDSTSQSTYIYNLICINEICHFINQKYTFPFSYVSFVISSSKPLYFYPVTKNSHFTEYFLVFDTPALDDLIQTSNKFNKKDVSNESFKTTDTSPTLFK